MPSRKIKGNQVKSSKFWWVHYSVKSMLLLYISLRMHLYVNKIVKSTSVGDISTVQVQSSRSDYSDCVQNSNEFRWSWIFEFYFHLCVIWSHWMHKPWLKLDKMIIKISRPILDKFIRKSLLHFIKKTIYITTLKFGLKAKTEIEWIVLVEWNGVNIGIIWIWRIYWLILWNFIACIR